MKSSSRSNAIFGFHSPLQEPLRLFIFSQRFTQTILIKASSIFLVSLAVPRVLPLVHLLCAEIRDKEEHFLHRQRLREARCCALDLIEQTTLFK